MAKYPRYPTGTQVVLCQAHYLEPVERWRRVVTVRGYHQGFYGRWYLDYTCQNGHEGSTGVEYVEEVWRS